MGGDQFPYRDTPIGLGHSVVVIGAGNTAMDCLRVAKRLGAERVRCVYGTPYGERFQVYEAGLERARDVPFTPTHARQLKARALKAVTRPPIRSTSNMRASPENFWKSTRYIRSRRVMRWLCTSRAAMARLIRSGRTSRRGSSGGGVIWGMGGRGGGGGAAASTIGVSTTAAGAVAQPASTAEPPRIRPRLDSRMRRPS